jgi:hypothetical protein
MDSKKTLVSFDNHAFNFDGKKIENVKNNESQIE